ncbi:MAG TPA: murein biosynthesis integral membrane protein MurJ [Mycobacteriales bacterium]|nr:murein biosynthesis integral membrane protein MurJ [Mycobacteriales bacterium]
MTRERPTPTGRNRDNLVLPGSLVRSGRAMAIGTLASRLTGFLRTVVIATAIGRTVGDSYNVANTLPNIVHELLLGGVLTSVVVPLVVGAARRDGDRGEGYAQRLLTVVVAGLSVASAIAVVFAPMLVRLYADRHGFTTGQTTLATSFARFFLPQILFYGVGALLAAILNTRGSFAPPMWAPVLNNLVVIAAGIAFFAATSGHAPVAGHLTRSATLILAVGTTAGIVVQTVALVPSLRKSGFHWAWRPDLRGAGLGHAARLGGWVLVYVAANQLAFLVITRLATRSGTFAISAYVYAFILVSLPHAVVAVSVITALLPRMSAHAADGRLDRVATDLARGLKLSGVLLVPAEAACVAFGPLLATVPFAHGHLRVADARLIGATLAGYAVSLVPFSAFQLQLRAFYALQDTRTPALVNIGVNLVNVAADVALYLVLPAREKVVGLAIGYSVSYLVGCLVFAGLLRRRLDASRQHVVRTYVRLGLAAVVAVLPAYALTRGVTAGLGLGPGAAFVALAAGLGLGGGIYVRLAGRLRVPEVAAVVATIRGR